MKPVSVRFKCFGPYLEEQSVDFSLLEKSGLFLICGETGSGKTTILDAMCYALYGKSSGGLRGDMTVMRCKQAQHSDETFVEFIFESGGSRYRFFRSMKPKNKRKPKDSDTQGEQTKKPAASGEFNITCECQKLVDGEFVPLADTKDKVTYLNSKAEEIIGLTYDQFRQVIILPQGQFERLLVSDSAEKESILVTLFHAEHWQQLAVRMFEIADKAGKELDREHLLIAEKLSSYDCQNPAELSEKAAEAKNAVEALQNELEAVEKLCSSRKKQHEQALLDNQGFEQRDELKKRLDSLSSQEEKYQSEEAALLRSDAADRITPAHADCQAALNKMNECEKAKKDADAALTNAKGVLEKVLAEQQRHEQRRAGYEQGKERIITLENARQLYQTLAQIKEAVRLAENERKTAAQQAGISDERYQKANACWEKAILEQKSAIEQHQTLQHQYLLGIGSTLAQSLVPGEKCPVCGSRSHPEPASPAEGHVTEEQLDSAAKAMQRAGKLEEQARKERSEAEKANTEARSILAQKQQQEAVRLAELERANAQKIEGIDDSERLEQEIGRYQRAIADYEKADSEMNDRVTAARSGHLAAQNGAESAESALKTASAAFNEQKILWQEKRTAAGFADDEQYRSACLEVEQKLARRTALLQFRADLANAQKVYNEKINELKDREQPDINGLKNALEETEKMRDSINGKLILARQQQKAMQSDAEELTARSQKYNEMRVRADESMVFAKRLRGDFGISLQRYVLGVMLTSITAAANRLLKTVYSGRYQLFRTNEAAGSSRKRGLELEVYDANNNERRSVTTLSGGEKFLVSLSLAIGLSTVVQAQGSGVRIEAMFIDEGFGSLDRDSINDALEVLQGIRRSSGLVGIISHVDQLAETIPAKIQITKTRSGSSCDIIC